MTSEFNATAAPGSASLDCVPHIHPPKIELFDVAGMSNTDPKGFRRVVDEYRHEEFGLYMARAIDGHPELTYVESWLLPAFGLRVSQWSRRPGSPRWDDRYVDVVDIDTAFGERTGAAGPLWRVVDVYLDILVRTGSRLEVMDTDELLAALDGGLIDAETAQRALHRVYRAVEGTTRHGYDIDAWLAASGARLTWRRPYPG